jgi:hypothetical protein
MTGQIEALPVRDRRNPSDRRDLHPPAPARVPEKAEKRPDLETTDGRLLWRLAPGEGGVRLVDINRDIVIAAETFGETEVIGIAVGENHALDLTDTPSHGFQLLQQLRPMTGQPRVDEGHPTLILDQVASDVIRSEPVE